MGPSRGGKRSREGSGPRECRSVARAATAWAWRHVASSEDPGDPMPCRSGGAGSGRARHGGTAPVWRVALLEGRFPRLLPCSSVAGPWPAGPWPTRDRRAGPCRAPAEPDSIIVTVALADDGCDCTGTARSEARFLRRSPRQIPRGGGRLQAGPGRRHRRAAGVRGSRDPRHVADRQGASTPRSSDTRRRGALGGAWRPATGRPSLSTDTAPLDRHGARQADRVTPSSITPSTAGRRRPSGVRHLRPATRTGPCCRTGRQPRTRIRRSRSAQAVRASWNSRSISTISVICASSSSAPGATPMTACGTVMRSATTRRMRSCRR